MAKVDFKYSNLLQKIISTGYKYEDPNRKGTYRHEIAHHILDIGLTNGFPAITTKKLFWKGVVGELLWFLRGDDNIKYLNDNNIHIWDKDAANFSTNGDVGKNYGVQWRHWIGMNLFESPKKLLWQDDWDGYPIQVDQIKILLNNLVTNPMGTRHIVTAWNPKEIGKFDVALPPCHWSFEIICYPHEDSYGFTLKWHQRSVDTFLGLPFNIASYALLAHIIGRWTGYTPMRLIGDLSNVHIYEPHITAVKTQLSRDVSKYKAPELMLPSWKQVDSFDEFINSVDIDDFKLIGYKSYPTISAEMIALNKTKV